MLEDIDEKVMNLLEKAIERKISSVVKSPYLPSHSSKTICTKVINKLDKAIYIFKTIEGLEVSRSTKRKDIDKIDCFWFDVFLNLDHNEKLCVLIYIDPFHEFMDKNDVRDFLSEFKLKYRDYNRILNDAFTKLQKLSEEKGFVESMNEDILKGWQRISEFWGCSIPRMRRLAVKLKLPISFLEGEVFAYKSKLEARRMELMENSENFVYNKKREE